MSSIEARPRGDRIELALTKRDTSSWTEGEYTFELTRDEVVALIAKLTHAMRGGKVYV